MQNPSKIADKNNIDKQGNTGKITMEIHAKYGKNSRYEQYRQAR